MEVPLSIQSKKRSRATGTRKTCSATSAPLRCHVVEDHCDALKHIHSAIRRRALPFENLSMIHFDAHPDLMVTPDLPASVCFTPHALYDALEEAEGGIAEWILPMVFQGHLSRVWWIRPQWAHQFLDGSYGFSVGQVKGSGTLRVSSTAPYFVDDRLYCPEEDMQNCKPIELLVSLCALNEKAIVRSADNAFRVGVAMDSAARSPVVRSEMRSDEESRQEQQDRTVAGDRSRTMVGDGGVWDIYAKRSERLSADGSKKLEGGGDANFTLSCKGNNAIADQVQSVALSAERVPRRPWILDICLDYFTTENPFMVELEALIGKDHASLVRAFYERPLFRGADTKLPHETQLEHERIFTQEVARLFDKAGIEEAKTDQTGAIESVQDDASSSQRQTAVESNLSTVSECAAAGKSGKKGTDADTSIRELERLSTLYDQDSESDRSLAEQFADLVTNAGSKERDLIAWANHCSCLPRHSATLDEIADAVSRVEELLRSILRNRGAGGNWEVSGRPGVVTVARSGDDGYVPANEAAFVERQVLAMLQRLFGDELGGLEIVYDEGLESKEE